MVVGTMVESADYMLKSQRNLILLLIISTYQSLISYGILCDYRIGTQ